MSNTGWTDVYFIFHPSSLLFSRLFELSFVSPIPAVDLHFHDVIVLAHTGHVAELN